MSKISLPNSGLSILGVRVQTVFGKACLKIYFGPHLHMC